MSILPYLGKCIIFFCDLKTMHLSSSFYSSYLQIEWETKKAATEGKRDFNKDTLKGGNPKVAQQNNYSDCGVYVLQYVESFFSVSNQTRLFLKSHW